MQAGDLNAKITIQHDTTDGTVDPAFADLFTNVWANKRAFKGSTFYGSLANQEKSNYVFTIRYTAERASGIKATMRIVDGDNVLDINVPPVDADNGKQWLEIYASETLQNGG